ncbi:MAG: hypothetical protein ABR518_02150 [Actinomycetota bacterium]
MRGSRLLLLCLLAVAAMATPPAVPPAAAQLEEPVTLRLRAQSPWNERDRPLFLSVVATNNTEAELEDLSVVLSIGTPTLSRSAYEQSLVADQTAFPFALPFQFEGTLAPHEARTFSIRHRLTTYPQPGQSGLYPIKVQLLAADVPQGTLRSAMVFLVEPPEVPLDLAWTWVLDTPLQRTPDGVFHEGPLPAAIAPGGTIDGMVRALDEVSPVSADIAVSPILADHLAAMATGYRESIAGRTQTVAVGTGASADAARVLATLQRVLAGPDVEVVGLPYGDARFPSLLRAGLAGDVPRLLRTGRDRVAGVLGATPTATVFRPPLSQVDAAAAAAVSSFGVETLLVDATTIPAGPDLPFAPPAGSARPVVRLEDVPGVAAVTPDPGVAAMASAYPGDPRLAAQAALGELAAIWLEFPGTAGRGAAVLFPETGGLDPSFYGYFANLVSRSPWLAPSAASDLVSAADDPPAATLPARSFRHVSDRYRRTFLDTRRALAQFDQALEGDADLIERLQDDLLLAEGAVAVSAPPLGERYLGAVKGAIEGTYRRVHPPPAGYRFTLTSTGEAPPLTMSNDSAHTLRVRVRLVSNGRLLFPRGNVREITLRPERVTLVRVPVQAVATGRFPVKVQVLTPGRGTPALIAETELVIRSTAYNRIALLLTIGAAVFLLIWWGRGFFRGRRGGGRRSLRSERGA